MAVLKDLVVHGASRFLNATYFNQIITNKIGAGEGVFNKIIATTGDIGSLDVEDLTTNKATVLSLLDVRGELHTNQWTNSNIATIDGSFYITPTFGVDSGTMTTTANSVTVNGSNFPISSVYVNNIDSDNTAGTVAWTTGSKVLVTGEILVNGTYMPLGTLVGTLGSNVTESRIDINNITDNRYQTAASLAEIGTQSTALPCRNVKISLYQTSRSSTLYPLGIFMTALGENGKTFLDIYGGGYATSTATAASGGFARPVLRIGNLAGLPNIGTQTPTGYGIYTSNGYFSGTVAAKKGVIGDGATAWTIGSGSGSGSVSYIYAPTNGPTSKTANTVGMYVGTDGINNFNTTTQYVRIYDGKIYAQGADITGKITASSGTIGGITLNSSYGLYTNSKTTDTSTQTGFFISKDGAIYLGAYNSTNGCCPFQVTSAGALTATSGRIGKFTITNTYLYTGTGTTQAGMGGDQAFWAGGTNSNTAPFRVSYAGVLNATGAQLKSLEIFDSAGNKRAGATTNGFIVYDGASATTTTEVAIFGSTVQVGKRGVGYTTLASTGMDIYAGSSNTLLAHIGYASGAGESGTSTAPYFTFGTRKSDSQASDRGNYSFAGGYEVEALAFASHAEGYYTLADSYASHAEGVWSEATGVASHAEGGFETNFHEILKTVASGAASHAEGKGTTAEGNASHAEGHGTTASGNYSHSGGFYTTAGYEKQTVIGEYNSNNSGNAFEIGNGTGENNRSNALAVDWNGNVNIPSGAKYKINGTALSASDITNSITGVKGGAESTYRTGNVDITAANVGALSTMSYTTITTTSKSVNSSTSYSTLKGVQFAPGLHFIQASCSFPQSSNANRRGGLRLVSGSNTTAITGLETKLTLSNNGETMAHISGWIQPTSTTTYNFQVFQNSGAALTLELVARYHTLS